MINNPQAPFIVVVHTNKYAGNFEREMAGFIAGIWDQETHGGHEAQLFVDEVPDEVARALSNKAAFLPTENNNHFSPVSIWPTPGRYNNGMGGHYDAGNPKAEAEAKRVAKEAMRDYQAPHIKKAQDRIDREDFEEENGRGAWTKEACLRTIKAAKESIERAGERVGYPAYESVAIFLNSAPTEAEIDLMWERAKAFENLASRTPRHWKTKDLTVKGLEVIKRETRILHDDVQIAKRA